MKTFAKIGTIAAAGLALILSSCSAGGGGTSPSGFLGEYSRLGGGRSPSEPAAYLNPKADFRDYDTILLDPVTTILSGDGADPRVVEQLAANFTRSLRSELGKEMRLTGTPGPRTLRVRVALTDVSSGQPGVNPVRTVHAAPRARLQGAVGGAAGLVSSISIEGEVLDSTSRARLSALSGQRLGATRSVNPDTDWVVVRAMIDESTANLRGRLFARPSR